MSQVKPILTLKQFMLRQEVLILYRRMLRAIKEIHDDQQRNEIRAWVRSEFRANINQKDGMAIKMLLNYGLRSLKELQSSINLAK